MFRFGRNARYNDPYRRLRDTARNFVRSSNARVVTASGFGGSGGSFGGSGSLGGSSDPFGAGSGGMDPLSSGMGGAGGGQGYTNDRFNPVFDHLEEGTVLEDWIARDGAGMDLMYRRIYLRDPTLGPGVDLIRSLPWSSYQLTGIDDPAILDIFNQTVESMNVELLMPDITGDMLVYGKSVSSLVFDSRKGIFSGVVPHNADFIRITPVPVYGVDPLCDYKMTPGVKKFLTSTDPRARDARQMLPAAFIEAGAQDSGFLPLDPVSTVYLARKLGSTDSIGTSLLTRALYFWAIEKALLNAQLTSTRRRSRSLAHIVAGIDGTWNPTPEEMDGLAAMVIQANEDPVGGVIATRTGVSINEPLGGGSDFYKWSDELELFAKYKMQSIGISDALINGDATYANAEQARSVFVEGLANLRSRITHAFFTKKVFPTISRLHGFVKRSKAELNHRIRTTSTSSYQEAYSRYLSGGKTAVTGSGFGRLTHRNTAMDSANLIIPGFSWAKQLKPTQDEELFAILERLKQNDYPVTLSQWAQAAGFQADPDTIKSEVEKDALLRREIQAIQEPPEKAADVTDEAPAEEDLQDIDQILDEVPEASPEQPTGEEVVQQSVSPRKTSRIRTLTDLPIWGAGKSCQGLTQREASRVMASLLKQEGQEILRDPEGLKTKLEARLGARKGGILMYCLNRIGLTRLSVSPQTAQLVVAGLKSRLARHKNLSTDQALLEGRTYEAELQHLDAMLKGKIKRPRKSQLAGKLSAPPVITAHTFAGRPD
jgi:hypothetical protein